MLTTCIRRLHPAAILPTYATEKSAGLDVYTIQEERIVPSTFILIHTGLVVVPPMNYHFLLFARSSLGRDFPGLILSNGVGVIDEDYSGPEDELLIPLLNLSNNTYCINKGRRIAQLVLRQNFRTTLQEIVDGNKLVCSRGGFGSSGGCV
jgi:dUTP pyrophosphatase